MKTKKIKAEEFFLAILERQPGFYPVAAPKGGGAAAAQLAIEFIEHYAKYLEKTDPSPD